MSALRDVPDDASGEGEPQAPERLTDGAAFILDEPTDAIPIWGQNDSILWAEGEAMMITGAPGAGKTTLAQRLVLAMIGLAPELLGLPVENRRKVLYLAMDRPRQIARSFRRMVTDDDRIALAERLVVWKGPPPADIGRVPETLVHLGRQVDADVIVIDSLKDAALGLVNDEVGGGVNRALQTAATAGIDVLVLHHQTKRSGSGTGGKPLELPDVYGSAWLTAGVGSVLLLHGDQGAATVELVHLKPPAEFVGPLTLDFDRYNGTIQLADDELDPLAWLRRQRQPITAQHLAAARSGPDAVTVGKFVERARRDLERLARAGLAHRAEGPRTPHGGRPTITYLPAAAPGQAALIEEPT